MQGGFFQIAKINLCDNWADFCWYRDVIFNPSGNIWQFLDEEKRPYRNTIINLKHSCALALSFMHKYSYIRMSFNVNILWQTNLKQLPFQSLS